MHFLKGANSYFTDLLIIIQELIYVGSQRRSTVPSSFVVVACQLVAVLHQNNQSNAPIAPKLPTIFTNFNFLL